jgi:hypothetical protein
MQREMRAALPIKCALVGMIIHRVGTRTRAWPAHCEAHSELVDCFHHESKVEERIRVTRETSQRLFIDAISQKQGP